MLLLLLAMLLLLLMLSLLLFLMWLLLLPMLWLRVLFRDDFRHRRHHRLPVVGHFRRRNWRRGCPLGDDVVGWTGRRRIV
jgi:hypothetical protein